MEKYPLATLHELDQTSEMTDVQVISLDGTWHLRGIDPDGGPDLNLTGCVPGMVHISLLATQAIEDPFWRSNADDCQWIERWDWVYEYNFVLDADSLDKKAFLVFGGIDTFATISLNGQELGKTANMFIPHRFAVSDHLQAGTNRIQVAIDSIWRHVTNTPRNAECAFETQERLYVRRMQCTFHWDWLNRFVSAGIWRSVSLELFSSARIEDLFVSTVALPEGTTGAAILRVRSAVEAVPGMELHEHLRILDPQGMVVWECHAPPGVDERLVTIPKPQCWWPLGHGSQPLYFCEVFLRDKCGALLDQRSVSFGIRTICIEHLPDAPGSSEAMRTQVLRTINAEAERGNVDLPGESFTVVVNGQRIYVKGGNWVPADPWPSRITGAHYERLLSLAADAHVNCLRAWGGGIYEPEVFWSTCDRLGILVAQDFQMACAHYPERETWFVEVMQKEFASVIRSLRNHPSLAWWIGDNENGMKTAFDEPTTAGRWLAEHVTGPAVSNLDPDRPFMSTSPYGGRPNSCQTIGDVHLSALPYAQSGYDQDWTNLPERIANSIGRFNSEYVTTGSPCRRSLLRFMTEDDIRDPDSTQWYFHTKDNPYIDVRQFDMQCLTAEKLFGPLHHIEEFVPRLEYAQFLFVRWVIEEARRQKGYNWGLLFWMYNDCWSATGWSLVDVYGTPKAAWYAMKRSFQPIIASLRRNGDMVEIWVVNDHLHPITGTLRLRRCHFTQAPQDVAKQAVNVPANASRLVGSVRVADLPRDGSLPTESLLVADLALDDGTTDRAWLLPPPPLRLMLPTANLVLHQAPGIVTISTDVFAHRVMLDGPVDFDDNYFDLLPGEQRTIRWSNRPEDTEVPTITARCHPATLDHIAITSSTVTA